MIEEEKSARSSRLIVVVVLETREEDTRRAGEYDPGTPAGAADLFTQYLEHSRTRVEARRISFIGVYIGVCRRERVHAMNSC